MITWASSWGACNSWAKACWSQEIEKENIHYFYVKKGSPHYITLWSRQGKWILKILFFIFCIICSGLCSFILKLPTTCCMYAFTKHAGYVSMLWANYYKESTCTNVAYLKFKLCWNTEISTIQQKSETWMRSGTQNYENKP